MSTRFVTRLFKGLWHAAIHEPLAVLVGVGETWQRGNALESQPNVGGGNKKSKKKTKTHWLRHAYRMSRATQVSKIRTCVSGIQTKHDAHTIKQMETLAFRVWSYHAGPGRWRR